MINKRASIVFGSGLLLSIASVLTANSMRSQIAPAPAGYQSILNTSGVKVFKNSARSSYITVIDLDRAEAIDLTGKYTDAPQGRVAPRSMSEFWQDSVSQNTPQRRAQVVINGAFFAKYNQPTGIAFGLKSAGTVISYGYGLTEFPGLNKTVAWNNDTKQAEISNYARSTFDNPQFPEVVGALAETAGKRANRELARTFIGVKDRDGDGKNETIIVFSSKAAKQVDAVETLKGFGAKQVAMLDGGGSTGLVVDGKRLIDSGTSIPHAIGFYSK
jgi:Phosphodiester glycosidase